MGMRMIIAPGDAEPVVFSDSCRCPCRVICDRRHAGAREALGREADEATRPAAAAKPAAAAAKREAAAATARRATRVAEENAQMPSSPMPTRSSRTPGRSELEPRPRTSNRRTPPKSRRCGRSSTPPRPMPKGEAGRRRGRGRNRQDGRGQAQRGRRGRDGREARRRSRLDLHQPRDAEALCAARHPQADPGRRREVRHQPGVPGHDQGSRQADRHAHFHRGRTRRGGTGGGLRWTEVSIDNGDTAKDALDRITFPQEVLDRIAPTVLPLSSMTISDGPPSSEPIIAPSPWSCRTTSRRAASRIADARPT